MKTITISIVFMLCLTGCVFRYVTRQDMYFEIVKEIEQDYHIKIARRDFVYSNDWDFDNLCDIFHLPNNTKAIHLRFINGGNCETYVRESFCRYAGYLKVRELIRHELLHCLRRCHKINTTQRQMIIDVFVSTGFGEKHIDGY